ncbi:MAG: TRAP transporter substrate-binding protein [Alphaproteobacteria bacterium]|nr:TRAP transporter substrate-binding protein [Alphaproteobacteria bacterium]
MLRYAFVLALGLAATAAQAQTIELKLGNTSAPGASQTAAAEEFAKRVNEKLAGKVKVTVFANSQLGNENELLQKLKIGTVDFSQPSTIMSTVAGEFGMFDMPYLIKDRAHMARFRDEVFWKEMAPKTEAQGLKIIAVWENGFRHITNNVRPINRPEDLKGIKLRVPPGIWRAKMFQAYGASPSPLQFNELFVALQTGVMDAQENPLSNIYNAKLHEVQKYLSMTNHVYTPSFLTVGAARWNKLAAGLRKEIETIALGTQPWVLANEEKGDKALLDKLKGSGIQINNADRDAFVKASGPIYEEFAKQVPGGKALVDKALALAK